MNLIIWTISPVSWVAYGPFHSQLTKYRYSNNSLPQGDHPSYELDWKFTYVHNISSSRPRFLYGKRLENWMCTKQTMQPRTPISVEDYKLIENSTLSSQVSYWNNEGKPGYHIMQHYYANPNGTPVVPAPVHWECALISYFLKGDISPPVLLHQNFRAFVFALLEVFRVPP